MHLVEILLLGAALSADAFAVTLSDTFAYQNESRAKMLLLPVAFGVFQALMPLLGYFLSGAFAQIITAYSGIVTFIMLGVIGGNMVREGIMALRSGVDVNEITECVVTDTHNPMCRLTFKIIVFQAVATALDAFAVGISLRAQSVNIWLTVALIGCTTFMLSLLALSTGRRFGNLLGDKAEVVGGIVLLCIGIKALLF
ncbi:manganese efflux pump MntP [Atopobium fossor]|uniref:manganese efflux pump MntP n=1 Tax=Atopobium fossor TaxID=39487 RepID=UPI0004074229|nr:manganese efflux pump MntP family protein [Atopobium fossor]